MDWNATHTCLHCGAEVEFEQMTYDEVVEKWGREDLAEAARCRCPECRRIFKCEALERYYDKA